MTEHDPIHKFIAHLRDRGNRTGTTQFTGNADLLIANELEAFAARELTAAQGVGANDDVSGLDLAVIGVRHFGNPIPQQWYSAARELLSTINPVALSQPIEPQGAVVSPEEVNALPDRIRRYIHDLETEADPAGTIRQNILVREENEMLRKHIELQGAE